MSANVSVNYSPVLLKIEDFPHGDTFLPDTIEVKDAETGLPIDLTNHTADMRIERRDGTLVANLSSAPGGGIALGNGSITIKTPTSAWPNNCTLYADLQMTTPGGNIETWIRFEIIMKRTITPP